MVYLVLMSKESYEMQKEMCESVSKNFPVLVYENSTWIRKETFVHENYFVVEFQGNNGSIYEVGLRGQNGIYHFNCQPEFLKHGFRGVGNASCCNIL